jgi:ankyrin repeat protein
MGKLHDSIRNGLTRSTMTLLASGAQDLNGHDAAGDTPLTLAITAGAGEIAEQLISLGADVNVPDR